MKRLSGFSLMEMMVVLLITAIVAAASAPMINKKLIHNQAENTSPWTYVSSTDNSIAFNLKNSDSQSVSIGSAKATKTEDIFDTKRTPKLYIKSNYNIPHITLETTEDASGGAQPLNIRSEKSSFLASSHIEEVHNSVVIGHLAGTTNLKSDYPTSKDNLIAIGYKAQANSNSVAIGYGAKASGDNSVAIGNGAKTELSSGTKLNNTIVLGTSGHTVYIPGNLVVGGSTYLYINEAMNNCTKNRYYKVLVGLLNEVGRSEDMIFDAEVNSSYGTTTELFNKLSDRRLKNIGKPSTAGLEEVKKLEVFDYTFKKDKSKTPHVGVMAQDLEKIFPNAVTKGEDGFLRIRMEDMFYAVVNAVKELDKKISLLEQKQNKIDELEARINKLEKRLEKLEKKLK